MGKASFSLKQIGPGTDVEQYSSSRKTRTHTELKLTNHLEGLLREGVGSDSEAELAENGLTYGHSILAAVVYERYDMAIEELDNLLSLKNSYPDFGERAGRFVQHGKSLVRAIKAKRAVGKLPHVSRSKQKELKQMLGFHFNELRTCVLNIEKVERYVRKDDISSTRWFIITVYWSTMAVFFSGLLLACFPDVFVAFHQVLTHWVRQGFSYLFSLVM